MWLKTDFEARKWEIDYSWKLIFLTLCNRLWWAISNINCSVLLITQTITSDIHPAYVCLCSTRVSHSCFSLSTHASAICSVIKKWRATSLSQKIDHSLISRADRFDGCFSDSLMLTRFYIISFLEKLKNVLNTLALHWWVSVAVSSRNTTLSHHAMLENVCWNFHGCHLVTIVLVAIE